jgi:hypothetical protein
MSLTQVKTSNIDDTGSGLNFRNRIINGDMRIDQRNSGVVTQVATYTLDRFRLFASQADKISVQQVADAPSGFSHSVKLTVLSSYNLSGTEQFFFGTSFEGNNLVDFAFGTSDAKATVLSFWVKSSITGKYSISWVNSANNYSFIGTYLINTADTWEYKTINIPAATGGVWGTDNNRHSFIQFMLGNSGTFDGTAGTWQSANIRGTSDSVDFVSQSNGATLQITGVQLEEGNAATAFERRPYGTELALCQRYAWKYGGLGSDIFGAGTGLYADGNEIIFGPVMCPVLMRAAPSMTVFGTPIVKSNGGASTGWTATIASASAQMPFVRMSKTSHGLTATSQTNLNFDSTSDYLIFNAEI